MTVLPTPTTRDWKGYTIRREPHRPDDMDTLARALTVTLPLTQGDRNGVSGRTEHGIRVGDDGGRLLPTPRAGDGEKGGPNQRGSSGDLMLPSAAVSLLWGNPECPACGCEWDMHSEDGFCTGFCDGTCRAAETITDTLIPTPSVADAMGGHERRGGARGDELLLKGHAKAGNLERWGQYAAAIQRWEQLTRPAPAPTETGPKGNPRLSAAFSEWLMGLSDGWVTDVPGITRNEALKAIGNGVVPQQCAAALRWLLSVERAA